MSCGFVLSDALGDMPKARDRRTPGVIGGVDDSRARISQFSVITAMADSMS